MQGHTHDDNNHEKFIVLKHQQMVIFYLFNYSYRLKNFVCGWELLMVIYSVCTFYDEKKKLLLIVEGLEISSIMK